MQIAQRMLRDHRLVEIDTQTWRVVAVEIPSLELRGAWHHLMNQRWKMILFLKPEAGDRKINMIRSKLIDRVVVAALLPCGAHTERFAQRRDLPCRRNPADLRHTATDEIDQPLGDQRHPLVRAGEQFAHGHGSGRDLADLTEPGDL